MSAERLQKILSRAGLASRRRAEELIREGRVTVNGAVARIGDKADLAVDAVKLNGKRVLVPTSHRYLLLNKPTGVLTTRSDPHSRRTVYDLLPKRLHKGLNPVGRLDYDTEGLLLLTDDGEFAQRVAHPRYGCVKSYEVKVKGKPAQEKIAELKRGAVIDGRKVVPVSITPMPNRSATAVNSWLRVELAEGRTRQIREMFFRLGHPVQKLRRVAIGGLRDPRLPLGAFRELTQLEVDRLLVGGKGKRG